MEQNSNDPAGLPPIAPPAPYPVASTGGLSDHTAAALAYVTFIPAILFLVMDPYKRSAFVRFHAFQSIAFSVVVFAIHVALGFIPILGWIILPIAMLAFFVLWVITVLKASKGEWYKLSLVGDFAMTQSRS